MSETRAAAVAEPTDPRESGAIGTATRTRAREIALSVRGLRKRYVLQRNLWGTPRRTLDAVKNVSLEIAAGETLALVGESGAGKSTVGRLVLRLIEPDAGEIRLLGRDITRLRGRELRRMRARATMIFQDPYKSLDPKSTIRKSLIEPLRTQRYPVGSEREEKITALIERVGLSLDHLDRFPYEMSGGQLQRVAIARALTTDPQLVVCDEPVAALDMSIRAHVINLLRDLQRERNLAYLFVSHDLSLVRVIADRIAVMRSGEIVECRSAAELFEDPQHEYTRELLAAIPAPHPRRRTFRPPPAD